MSDAAASTALGPLVVVAADQHEPSPLVHDPWAARLLPAPSRFVAAAARWPPVRSALKSATNRTMDGGWASFLCRKRYIDDQLCGAITKGVDAVVRDFGWLVARLRSGPPRGFFRLRWVRDFPSLNEFFVHHEDVRRANGMGPRKDLTPDLEAALWRNVQRSSRFLSRRQRAVGLDIAWAGTRQRMTVRKGDPAAELKGTPGELLLYLFGRQAAARVEVSGPPTAVAAVRSSHLGI